MSDIFGQYLREEAMREIFTGSSPEKNGSESAQTAVERIDAYLASNAIVLFMKGSPDFPQCGFSARVVNALRTCRANFTHVNILEDAELRQALKTYASWPTFPQLYVEGEFVGGCDIVMDLYQSGDLSKMLRRAGAVFTE
jgi:monothiol glutaredoxin